MTISEQAIRANEHEAQRLYQRGVAAARGGQRRVAVGLLTRSLRLNPDSEQAWLWLSGVLDEPGQQAFCLEAVLKLNPENQHALRGLRMLEQRGLAPGVVQPAPGLDQPSPASAIDDAERRDSWWVSFRRNRHEMNRARLLLWSFPIALVCVAIVLYQSFVFALEQSLAAQVAAPTLDEVVVEVVEPVANPLPTIEPILEAEPLAVVESLSVGYLNALEPVRESLRVATATYHDETTRLVGGSVGAATANQRLRAAVDDAITAMDALRPPATLQQAHDDYRRGLELQREGLDAVLVFFSSYEVANANRAALRFQESRAYIERAQSSFAAQSQLLAELSALSAQTAR
ncbi:hypothetical protein [Candidatus Viridilinea mediisalina]|uniref:Uncharacterized protein n=1 Tax=Candidatus Viridilinea mediisalina TaxID=2024553 RepID=A0A2A6RJ39_9CHLR|nr:hypothetical protein [Candidatus Viridilinea mediisalina]PDW03144.1 hypothetical protein CJ255_10250 [Candidatus Viridilinea mediisalina]